MKPHSAPCGRRRARMGRSGRRRAGQLRIAPAALFFARRSAPRGQFSVERSYLSDSLDPSRSSKAVHGNPRIRAAHKPHRISVPLRVSLAIGGSGHRLKNMLARWTGAVAANRANRSAISVSSIRISGVFTIAAMVRQSSASLRRLVASSCASVTCPRGKAVRNRAEGRF